MGLGCQAHCWVLKDQAAEPVHAMVCVGEVSGASGPPFAGARGIGWLVLVGLLFEICIVDASIFVAKNTPASSSALPLLRWRGVVVGGVVSIVESTATDAMFMLHGRPGWLCRWTGWVRGGVWCGVVTLLRQAMKGTWWMPWHQEPMKDVGACDKPWGVGNQAVIRGCPNGETQHESCRVTRT